MNRRLGILLCCLVVFFTHDATAQEQDLVGFKGGYKAFSRLCTQNLDNASHLLANDYSRGYFVSLTIPPGTDTVGDISFLTATPSDLAAAISWALKGTNGQWIRRPQIRRLLIPIFFCQNAPPNDSLFSQLLVTNNIGFSVPGAPDQWPEAAEGVWLHPICPLVTTGSPRVPPAPPATAVTTTVQTPTTAVPSTPAPATAATTTSDAAPPPGYIKAPPGYIMAPTGPDTVSMGGIYSSQDQFEHGVVVYGTTYPIEEKGLLSWYEVDFAAYGPVRVRTPDKNYQSFSPGAIYGFKSDNISFVYLKSSKEYLSVAHKGRPFYLLMDERKQAGYNGSSTLDGVFYYAKTLDGPWKEFTKKNLDNDFGSNPALLGDVQILRKELNKHSVTMSRGDFESCRVLAKDYLTKWETAP